MRSRALVGVVFFIGILSVGTFASSGASVAPAKQSAIVNFMEPVSVNGNLLMGSYLIVHDEGKMARGEPCTTFYRFDRSKGPREEEVTFMCRPEQRTVCDKTTFSVVRDSLTDPTRRLVEFQFAGDSEGHGIPAR